MLISLQRPAPLPPWQCGCTVMTDLLTLHYVPSLESLESLESLSW